MATKGEVGEEYIRSLDYQRQATVYKIDKEEDPAV